MSSQAFLRSMFASEEESESESLLESESLDELSFFFFFKVDVCVRGGVGVRVIT